MKKQVRSWGMAQKEICTIWMFKTEAGDMHVDVFTKNDAIWVTQRELGEFFQVGTNTINYHIKAIYETGELASQTTSQIKRVTRKEGSREVVRDIAYYNLEMVLAIGYRVKSERGNQFRTWASTQLNDYLINGFAMHTKRLAEGQKYNTDYFLDLLERIRLIRLSDKRFYQQVVNIFATAIDYDSEAEETKMFLDQMVEKFYVAITGQTQAQLIDSRADAEKSDMGIQNHQVVNSRSIEIARNYLTQEEEATFSAIAIKYIDYATLQASKLKPMYMADWAKRLDQFLEFNVKEVKKDKKVISIDEAKEKIESLYRAFQEKYADEMSKQPDEFEKLMKAIGK
jgi:hypothetical protein